jgi:hypothetical protein
MIANLLLKILERKIQELWAITPSHLSETFPMTALTKDQQYLVSTKNPF